MSRWIFYRNQIVKYFDKSNKILLLGASDDEVKIFLNLGFKNLYVGYFDDIQKNFFIQNGFIENKNLFKIDIRKIPFKENSFDYTFTHATIHHVDLPHLAVTELYRVAKIGCLIIESNDSFIMRLATKFGFSEEFEVSSIKSNGGGLLNSSIPNYIYRWNENEINKLIKSYKPEYKHNIFFDYFYDSKNSALEKNILKKIVKKILSLFLRIIFIFFVKQKNVFSFFIEKKNKKKRF